MADDPTILGTCTVIAAREEQPDALADDALLRDVATVLGLQPGSLARPNGMSRPEFRLVEGVSRETADRVSALAIRHGFNPRVRDRLGIKWSSERSPVGLMVMSMALTMGLVVFSALAASPSALSVGLALYGAGFVALMLGWRRSLYLPLAVPRAALPVSSAPMVATAVPEVERSAEVDDAAKHTRRALDGLLRLLASQALPAVATSDLRLTHGELTDRVNALTAEALELPRPSAAALESLSDRLETLGEDDAAEAARLRDAIEEEEAAQRASESRIASIVADLLAIRRTVSDASAALQDVPDDGDDAAQRLQAQIADLHAASEESRKMAASRARQALLSGQRR